MILHLKKISNKRISKKAHRIKELFYITTAALTAVHNNYTNNYNNAAYKHKKCNIFL